VEIRALIVTGFRREGFLFGQALQDYEKPEELTDVPIAVGMRARSDFNLDTVYNAIMQDRRGIERYKKGQEKRHFQELT
jgi:hypothetical protein